MNNNTYNIQTVQIGAGLTTKPSSKIQFFATYMPNSTEMPFSYNFMDDADESLILYSGDDMLGADVLAGWGENDDYIIQAMATKVGVTLV